MLKYPYQNAPVPLSQRKTLNEKVIYLIDNGCSDSAGITPSDIFNAYTGDGGLHNLQRDTFDNYHEYSEAKKRLKMGSFLLPPRCVSS